MSEGKIHSIDEKLDKLETLIAIMEAKMGSLPDEAFEHPPPEQVEEDGELGFTGATAAVQNLAMTDTMAKP